ncbi:hypothetical protein A3K29_03100 [Candidatus Collierbacteria bacterium RIFOXYB2_FULL_46_14]|uniref:GDP-6-deoxy-D-mannose reductase n=1 Tax=Candidatus Collierbacteria bacterium GW2011_GWA2_46_26 TaxID=1618381 RepID=A0A0G1RV20_9BACT|nr:MAG: GDP-6-deoxy-D-mannose reductase [Candidatus Collierbacteria bacterium GW2011_GWC2_44_13]KKU33823.1 MAG: GDP-6-deoxy-D-mannose reductase [Candidatus Collierbacteria bacterium GW2011_GWA2_46_26]OGD73108.1 MAG: hypothetical protein A3K29_03100 [Candidatus Collierbacteria bacterium RIFOXYB2_FULL_46_14]OGD76150.1 MAG: hypothetical protein A3K43_03100 [Candidatus Collierbacteria bacterium RIFOXYA2_FULL_46_20]OGD77486.1 MAG: hypothetical protein A3K39_03100 [Candidatus Collierbacteria bacteriu
MKKALITGSTGFVGGHLWKELESAGYQVFGTSRTKIEPKNSRIFACDITNEKKLAKLIAKLKPDHIYHLAAQPSPRHSYQFPQKTFEINNLGTINLLEAIKNIAGYTPRVLVVGSATECGFVPAEQLPITEATPFAPENPYSISKLACYHLSLCYARDGACEVIYASSFSHTGPGQATGFLAADIAKQIVEIENGHQEAKLVTGHLENLRDYLDVRDVAKAYRLLLEKGKNGERYNVCSGITVSTKTIFQTLLDLSKVKIDHQVDPSRNNAQDAPILYGSHDKITKETGWVPQISIDQTLKDLLDWYRAK